MDVCASGTPIVTVSCGCAGSVGADGSSELLDVACGFSASISMPDAAPGNGAIQHDFLSLIMAVLLEANAQSKHTCEQVWGAESLRESERIHLHI